MHAATSAIDDGLAKIKQYNENGYQHKGISIKQQTRGHFNNNSQ